MWLICLNKSLFRGGPPVCKLPEKVHEQGGYATSVEQMKVIITRKFLLEMDRQTSGAIAQKRLFPSPHRDHQFLDSVPIMISKPEFVCFCLH